MGKGKSVVKTAVVKIELEYTFDGNLEDKEIINFISNDELPDNYKEDSWEFIRIVNG